jgi:Lipocalin-like domain
MEVTMRALRIATILAVAGLWAGAASAQSLKQRIVGTWTLKIAEITAANGSKTLPFGPSPKGQIVFTPDGHFSQVHVSSGLPKIAGNNRLNGTDADNRAIVQGTLSFFGTYSVDEEKKTVTFNIVASTYPNAEGTSQTRTIDKLTADEFVNTNRGAARDGPAAAANYYTRAK